jgi:hypothetical protein
MSEITETRLDRRGLPKEIPVITDGLLCHEFVGEDGKRIRVSFTSNGQVEISTPDGRMIVKPSAANVIRVTAEPLQHCRNVEQAFAPLRDRRVVIK